MGVFTGEFADDVDGCRDDGRGLIVQFLFETIETQTESFWPLLEDLGRSRKEKCICVCNCVLINILIDRELGVGGVSVSFSSFFSSCDYFVLPYILTIAS